MSNACGEGWKCACLHHAGNGTVARSKRASSLAGSLAPASPRRQRSLNGEKNTRTFRCSQPLPHTARTSPSRQCSYRLRGVRSIGHRLAVRGAATAESCAVRVLDLVRRELRSAPRKLHGRIQRLPPSTVRIRQRSGRSKTLTAHERWRRRESLTLTTWPALSVLMTSVSNMLAFPPHLSRDLFWEWSFPTATR